MEKLMMHLVSLTGKLIHTPITKWDIDHALILIGKLEEEYRQERSREAEVLCMVIEARAKSDKRFTTLRQQVREYFKAQAKYYTGGNNHDYPQAGATLREAVE
jgi:hypothetical protein